MSDVEAVATLLAGPASAVGICVLVGWAAWNLIVNKMIPSYEARIGEILEEHRKDRKVFIDAVELIDRRFQVLEKSVGAVRKDVADIEKEVRLLKPKA